MEKGIELTQIICSINEWERLVKEKERNKEKYEENMGIPMPELDLPSPTLFKSKIMFKPDNVKSIEEAFSPDCIYTNIFEVTGCLITLEDGDFIHVEDSYNAVKKKIKAYYNNNKLQ